MRGDHDLGCRIECPTCICLTCKKDWMHCCMTMEHEKTVRCPKSRSDTNNCPDYERERRKRGI